MLCPFHTPRECVIARWVHANIIVSSLAFNLYVKFPEKPYIEDGENPLPLARILESLINIWNSPQIPTNPQRNPRKCVSTLQTIIYSNINFQSMFNDEENHFKFMYGNIEKYPHSTPSPSSKSPTIILLTCLA